ncbi:hypothetical protein, partial [Campylobacter rectus]
LVCQAHRRRERRVFVFEGFKGVVFIYFSSGLPLAALRLQLSLEHFFADFCLAFILKFEVKFNQICKFYAPKPAS